MSDTADFGWLEYPVAVGWGSKYVFELHIANGRNNPVTPWGFSWSVTLSVGISIIVDDGNLFGMPLASQISTGASVSSGSPPIELKDPQSPCTPEMLRTYVWWRYPTIPPNFSDVDFRTTPLCLNLGLIKRDFKVGTLGISGIVTQVFGAPIDLSKVTTSADLFKNPDTVVTSFGQYTGSITIPISASGAFKCSIDLKDFTVTTS